MKQSKRTVFPVVLGTGFAAIATICFFIFTTPSAELSETPAESNPDWRETLTAETATADERRERSEPRNPSIPAPERSSESSLPPDARLLADRSASVEEREKAAFRLAREHPDIAFKALRRLLEDDGENPHLRSAAARALLQTGHPDARSLVERLTRDDDPVVARGAVRGIASQEDEPAAEFLSELLYDGETTDSVRSEAALGLAQMDSAQAVESLLRATYSDIDSDPNEPVLHAVLHGLAANHYDQAGEFLNAVLSHPEMDSASKAAAIDGMSQAEGSDALNSLLEQAGTDDPDLREAAAWAIATREDVHMAGPELLGLLENESVPWVRTSLYQALQHQDQLDAGLLWNQVASESDQSARLAGYQVLARHLPDDQIGRFDSEVVPDLRNIAKNDPNLNNRLNATIALGRAKTSPGAVEALLDLQEGDVDDRTRHAAELALRP